MKNTEKTIKNQFNKGCVRYHLLEDGDNILVAVSGGKDSMILLRLMAQRAKIYKPHIHVEAAHVIMDNIPYETDCSYLQSYCDDLGVKLHIIHSSFDESTDPRKTKCFLCSWNRRKAMFEFACNNGFNKVALGHHNDDILTTLLMNMTYEGSFRSMPPALALEHFNITVIRPMCLVIERDLKEFSALIGIKQQKAKCPYEEETRRASMNKVFHTLEEMNPEARYSLWKAMYNIKEVYLPPE